MICSLFYRFHPERLLEGVPLLPKGPPLKDLRAVSEYFVYNKYMSSPNDQKVELLNKTADFYRRSIENYGQFAKTERKPRTKKQLEARLKFILNEIDTLSPAN